MVNKPVYVTPKGKADLEKEIEHLRNVELPKIIESLQEVKSGGDWMEDSEQMLFEDELSFVERRLQDLEGMLADSQIIEPDQDFTIVNIGDTVVLENEEGELETYTIVGITEADPGEGTISNESPLGKALLKKKVGENVVVEAPVGQLAFRIVDVKQ